MGPNGLIPQSHTMCRAIAVIWMMSPAAPLEMSLRTSSSAILPPRPMAIWFSIRFMAWVRTSFFGMNIVLPRLLPRGMIVTLWTGMWPSSSTPWIRAWPASW